MPTRYQNVRQNFSAGEVTPRLSLRVDHGAYENACSATKNFIVTPQGTAIFREGWQHLGAPPSEQEFRIFQFHRGGDESDLLIEVSQGIIRYWVDDEAGTDPHLFVDLNTVLTDEDDGAWLTDEDDGAILTLGTVTGENPYTVDELDSLYFTNQDKYGILYHDNHPPLYITIERDGTISAELFPLERIPLYAYQDTNNPGYVATTADWTITFPASWADNPFIYYVTYNGVQGINATGVPISYAYDTATPATNETNIQAMLDAAAARQGMSPTFVVSNVAGTQTYTVNVTGDDSGWVVGCKSAYWSYYGTFWLPYDITDVNPQPIVQPADSGDATEEPAWSYPTYVTNGGNYYQCRVVHTSAASSEPGVGADWELYWLDLGIAVPTGFDYQFPSGNAWATATNYAPGNRGFPTVGVFNEQRLIHMANRDNPTALYGSQIGYYLNYKPGPNDDDPFLFVLDSSDTPQIKWARSQRELTLGTSSGEWIIKATVTITPTDIAAKQQNNARSKLALPVQIDTEIFYIEQGGKKVRVTRYVNDADALVSQDASLLAEHLIADVGVKRIVASFIPNALMTILREDGQVVYFTYEKTGPVLAFTHSETDGTVYDIASYFALPTRSDYTYYSVQRNGRYALERMRYADGLYREDLTGDGVVHLDGWVTGTVVGDYIDGLDHLEGKEVWVLVDDAWQIGTFTVYAGRITLPENEDGKTFAVGLPFYGDLTTFEMTDNNYGTGFGTKRRWERLFTRILNSGRPKVYGERASDRQPSTPMGTAETILEGVTDLQQNNLGYGNGAIVVYHDRPYPLQILGYFGEYQVEDR